MAPIHTTLTEGQEGIAAVAALVGGMLFDRSGRTTMGGLMYGLSIAVKVQIGLPFLAYLLWRRRWRTAAVAGVVVLTLTIIAVAMLQHSGVPWLKGWIDNVNLLSGPQGMNNPGPQNPDRASLINLQFALRSLFINESLVDAIALVIVGVFALAFVRQVGSAPYHGDLLPVSMVSVLTLLVTYHRTYDAVLLVFPIAWAFSAVLDGRRLLGGIALLLSFTFLLPIQVFFATLQQNGQVPSWLTRTVVWESVLLPLHVWALVSLAVVFLIAAVRDSHLRARSSQGSSNAVQQLTAGP